MSLQKRFQYYVRPAWFVVGWLLVLLLWLFYLPTLELPLIPLSIWGVALLASPYILYRYWRDRPPQLTLSSERLDDAEVGLPVNHINETDHLDGRLLRRLIPLDLTGSVGILGATRSGKTNAAKLLVDQLRDQADEQTPFIIYDHKTDFQDHLDDDAYILLSGRDADVQWNVFEEVESDQECEELARELFPAPTDGSDFFADASRQLFAAVLKVMRREAPDGTTPTNDDLVTWIESTTVEELADTLAEHPDLQGITDYIDPDAAEQSQGVMASFRKEIRNMFQGDLCEAGSWSIRQYVADPQGKVLIIDYPQRLGESTKPLIRFTIDWAIRFALDDGEQSAYFVLDEFARLPPLRRIGDLVNVGAGQDTRALITLQSVAQLYVGMVVTAVMHSCLGCSRRLSHASTMPRVLHSHEAGLARTGTNRTFSNTAQMARFREPRLRMLRSTRWRKASSRISHQGGELSFVMMGGLMRRSTCTIILLSTSSILAPRPRMAVLSRSTNDARTAVTSSRALNATIQTVFAEKRL